MKVPWDTVAAKLGLDDGQATIARYLLDRGREDCLASWQTGTTDHERSPLDYLVELRSAAPALAKPDADAKLIHYLSTKQKLGAGVSFLQVQYEQEVAIKMGLWKLRGADPAATLTECGIGSLLFDVVTGYDPVEACVDSRMKGDPAANGGGSDGDSALLASLHPRVEGVTSGGGIAWSQVQAELALDEAQSRLLRYLLDELQDRCGVLWSTLEAGYGLSPLEFVADLKIRDAAIGHDAIASALKVYLASHRPLLSNQTFIEQQAAMEASIYHGIARVMGGDRASSLRLLANGSLLNISTGHHPIVHRFLTLYEENRLKRGIDLYCGMPFEYAHIEDTGEVLPCCPSKFRLSIGNLKQNTMQEVWNSTAAVAVRESIHDKSFRFCNYHACEYLKKGRANSGTN
jgi:hypothetical protein